MDGMRISQLAETSGVPATTLRFYETEGLLTAARTSAGYRVYGPEAVERLGFIGAAKQLGLRLEEIAGLLGVWESGPCAQVKAALRPRITAHLADAETRQAELTSLIASLRAALAHLDALPDRAGRCDPECGLPTTRQPGRRSAGVDLLSHTPTPAEPAVACALDAGEQRDRVAEWRRMTADAVRTTLDGGLRLSLPVERTVDLARLTVAEQRCCPFFDFRLHLDGPLVHLDVRAPAEAAGLVGRLF